MCVTKLRVTKLCVTKLCVTKSCVTKLCVCVTKLCVCVAKFVCGNAVGGADGGERDTKAKTRAPHKDVGKT